MNKHICILALAILAANLTGATYRAHDPAWRGVWLWQRVAKPVTAHLVDMRDIMEQYPGSCEISTVNRISGRDMACGLTDFYIRFEDTRGNLLYPAADRSRVLHFDNWGIDFGKFDYIQAWEQIGQRTGCKVVFTGSAEELPAFRAKYPSYTAIPLDQVPGNALKGPRVNWEKLAPRNLVNVPMEFQRRFTLASAPKAAQLSITATGTYELFINGRAVGRDSDWVLAENYDVAGYLKAGENLIEVTVDPDREMPGLLANANITLADGTVMHLDTDLQWQCRPSGSGKPWAKPVPVGFEGAGPRFRLRESFKYPAKNYADRIELLATASDCTGLAPAAAAALAATAQAPVARLEFQFARPMTIREVRLGLEGMTGCRLYGQDAASGQWRLLRSPYKPGQTGGSFRRGCFNLPISPARLKAIRIDSEWQPGNASLNKVEIIRSEEE